MGEVKLLENLDDALELRRWLGERRFSLAVDTETEGLDAWRHQVRLVQFGDTETGWSIPAQDWRGFVRDCLEDYEGEISMHNAKFDAHMLNHFCGWEPHWERVHDTEVQSHMLFPPGRHGLKIIAVEKINPGAAGGQMILDKALHDGKWNWATVPVTLPEYWGYGALDTVLTAQLDELQRGQIAERGLTRIYDLERASTPVFWEMERHGMAVDLEYCRTMGDEMNVYTAQVKTWAREVYGVDNLMSTQQLGAALVAAGVPLRVRTKKGAWSLTEEILEQIEHPLAQAVLNCRKATKIVGSYFDNFRRDSIDGVVHPNIRQVGARTGRSSITHPALQTLPRGAFVRDAFIPRPGYKFVSVDFEQIEARIFAAFANEDTMIKAIADYDSDHTAFVDLHTWVAREVYRDPTITKHEVRRQIAKTVGLGVMFGSGAEVIAKQAGVSVEDADSFKNMYMAHFPGAKRYQRECEMQGRTTERETGTGYCTTTGGRYLPLWPDEGYYKLINYRIQGSAGDIFKDRMVSVANAGFLPYMVLPIHDEILLELPEEWAAEAIPHIVAAMEDRTTFAKVPLLTSASAPVDRWGAAK